MIYGIACYVIGFLCGMLVMALMAIASAADEQQERMRQDWWGRGL